MAKTRTRVEPITSVTIKYDLFELPTAQHKAGLAGLILQIQSMKGRRPDEKIPVVEELMPTTATVRFTRESTEKLFDDLYEADLIESAPREKPRKKAKTKEIIPPIRIVPIEKTKKTGN